MFEQIVDDQFGRTTSSLTKPAMWFSRAHEFDCIEPASTCCGVRDGTRAFPFRPMLELSAATCMSVRQMNARATADVNVLGANFLGLGKCVPQSKSQG